MEYSKVKATMLEGGGTNNLILKLGPKRSEVTSPTSCLLLLRYPSNTKLGSPHNRSRSFEQEKDLLLQPSYWTDCPISASRSLHNLKSAMTKISRRRISYINEWLLKYDVEFTAIFLSNV